MINIKKIERITPKDIDYRIVYKLLLETKNDDITTEAILETNVFGGKDIHLDDSLDSNIKESLTLELEKLNKELKLP